MQYLVCSVTGRSVLPSGMLQLAPEMVSMVVVSSLMKQEVFTPEALQETVVFPPPAGNRVGLASMEAERPLQPTVTWHEVDSVPAESST